MVVRALKIAFALLGIALFAYLLRSVDLGEVLSVVASVGVAGFGLILAIYAVEFLCDVLAWQCLLGALPTRARWTTRLYLIRMAGEAYNVVTPLGGMGGEPVKALILNRRYAAPYSLSSASLVLAKTSNVLSLVAFLVVGFILMLDDPRIGRELQLMTGFGLAALSAGIGGFFLVQRLRLTSRLARRLGGPSRPGPARVVAGLQALDEHLVDFYTRDPARFMLVLILGFSNWVLGALGVWATMHFMQRPVSVVDAWIIEAVAQMARAATFFIPASLGAQEGAIMLVTGAVTGNPGSGLALALLRRARELLWVLLGLGVSAALLGSVKSSPGDRRAS